MSSIGAVIAAAVLLFTGCAVGVDGTPTAAPADQQPVAPEPVPTVVVLDASDSMNTEDAPGRRLDAARESVIALADGLPDETLFGVVAFGSQLPARSTPAAQGCRDVTTAVAMGPLNTKDLKGDLGELQAQGFTPIAGALEAAFALLPGSGRASVVLVSDGESTCAPPPCETAAALHRARPEVTISAVGFRTDDPSLACVAESGGGLFVTADNAAQLSARLAAAQNAEAAATRLSPTSRAGISIGQSLSDIRQANPTFPSAGRNDGDRTVYVWIDCDYAFVDDVLVEIAPGDPPGSAGATIDGVSRGTPGARAIELYGQPLTDSDGVAVFTGDTAAGTAYRIGYEGGFTISEGTVTWVVLCRCLPSTGGSDDGGPEVVKVVAVDPAGKPVNGFTVGNTGGPWTSSTTQYCTNALGAATTGVYRCGSTADSANACWPSNGRLLCTYDPWAKALTSYSYSGSLPTLEEPSPDVFPWALELANGQQCTARSGGAWPMPPQGFEFGYSCRKGSDYSFVLYPSSGSELFDKSGAEWTVYFGDGESTPVPVAATKVYYAAAQ
ncbi:VWA domain-containing protein [Gordonia sp. zg691]|uniref:vWA domain-containing protein n=1 Tax=Gordonia jinghuaiqii TaxID=2758710 RepID=UPI0016626E03|nr:VWA domain-containing protein [Gordonia jinghuaiqii]MBD0863507.1 VWA domain-containing protein [Gordonia jinghuaiqii]